MPTKNFVTDFGGVGDGQRVTLTVTVGAGTGALSVGAGTGNFVLGDVGKAIQIRYSGNDYTGTITARSSADAITISPTIASGIGGVSSDVAWGTDNTAAFTGASGSWRAYARTQTNPADIPILQIPDGNYLANVGPFNPLHEGVLNDVKVTGLSGNAANCKLMRLNSGEFRFGSDIAIAQHGLLSVGGNSVRLQTASAGSGTITLSNPSGTFNGGSTYGSRITVGRVCLIAAFDMQSINASDYGYPPNSYFFEWNVITAYNSGTGVVTLQNPLTQAYKSTYPSWGLLDTDFGAGGTQGSDQGGPATLWVAPDGYNTTVTLENMTIDNPSYQSAVHRRYVILNNLVMSGPGIYPTQNDTVVLNNCVYNQDLEIDKMTNQVTWNNCTIKKLQQFSASPNRMIVNGGTIQALETAKYTECNNVAFTGAASVTLGVLSYGKTDRVVLNGCTGIAAINRTIAATDDLFGTSGPGAQGNASTFYTFTGGVLRFLKTANDAGGGVGNTGQQNPTRLLMPGTWVLFDDKYMDQVSDVYEDGTYCYIQFANTTNWPFTPVVRLRPHPCPDLTVTGCTGTAFNLDDFQLAPSRSPAYSYSFRTYVAGASAGTVISPTNSPVLFGKFVTEKVNVTTRYVAGNLWINESQFNNRTQVKRSDWSTSADYGNSVFMGTLGLRTIRGATTPTGTQVNDTLEDQTSIGEVNFNGGAASGVIFSSNVTNGETPTVTIEYVMDQGIPPAVPTAVAPLRLRLRAA